MKLLTSKAVNTSAREKNIKLSDDDHNISCKIWGLGAMGLKSEYVRKDVM